MKALRRKYIEALAKRRHNGLVKIVSDGAWNYIFIDEIQLTRRILPPDVDLERIAPEDRESAYVTFYDTLNGLELVLRGCQVDVGVVTVGSKQHEIDFVVNRAPGKLYIQVALELPTEEKREQEVLPLRKCDDFFRKMIVTRGNAPLTFTGDGIMQVGAIPFLLDESILDKALSD